MNFIKNFIAEEDGGQAAGHETDCGHQHGGHQGGNLLK